jgi:alpha-1,6-mannosyltransferase
MLNVVLGTVALKCILDASAQPWNTYKASKQYRLCLFLLTVAGVIFRSELAILVATITLYLFLTRRLSILQDIIPAGLGGLVIGLSITVPIDSYFWQSFPLWPEWTAFYYNTILGHSADWGVSPWHFYFLNALPRLLLNPLTYLLCIPIAIISPSTRPHSLDLLIPSLTFVAVYSVLPHKEWRFIIYIIPALTSVAAAGASYIWTRRGKSYVFALLTLALVTSVLASFTASTALLAISALNYPGGAALSVLHTRFYHPNADRPLRVHFNNLACQTGVTRFLEDHSGAQTILDVLEAPAINNKRVWSYDKTEDPERLLDPLFWHSFDFVLAERPEKVIGKWDVVHVEYSFTGIQVLSPGEVSHVGSSSEPLDIAEWEDDAGGNVVSKIAGAWRVLEDLLRDKVLRGWWIEVRLEPRLRILANRMEAMGDL